MSSSRPAGTLSWRASSRRGGSSETGVSLLETLAALALTGLLVALMVPILGQTLSRWSARMAQSQFIDQTMRASVALQSELTSLDPVRFYAIGATEPSAWFAGDKEAIVFVGHAAGAARPQVITLTIDRDGDGAALVRRAADFGSVAPDVDPRSLPSPNAVLTGASAMRFGFVGADGVSRSSWIGEAELPAVIELVSSFASRGGLTSHVLSFPLASRRPPG